MNIGVGVSTIKNFAELSKVTERADDSLLGSMYEYLLKVLAGVQSLLRNIE